MTDSKFKPSGFTVAWVIWIVFFLVVEGIALVSRKKDLTFSEHWWALFRVRTSTPWWAKSVLVLVQLGFGIWLVGHLTFGLWSF